MRTKLLGALIPTCALLAGATTGAATVDFESIGEVDP